MLIDVYSVLYCVSNLYTVNLRFNPETYCIESVCSTPELLGHVIALVI